MVVRQSASVVVRGVLKAGGAIEAGEADSELMRKVEYPVVWEIAMVVFLDLEPGFTSRRVK